MSDDKDKSPLVVLLFIAIAIGIGCLLQLGCLKVIEHETMRSNEAIRRGYFE